MHKFRINTLHNGRHTSRRRDIRVVTAIATVFDSVMIINQLGVSVNIYAYAKKKMA
jgi:hypothetical protein